MRELSVNEITEVSGGEWEDIGCTSDGKKTTCQGSLADVADGINDAVKALNDVGTALGSWLYDTLN